MKEKFPRRPIVMVPRCGSSRSSLFYLLKSNFTRGELKIGRSVDRNCPSFLTGVSNAPALCYRGTATHFYDGQHSPNLLFFQIPGICRILAKIPKKSVCLTSILRSIMSYY